MSWKKSAAGGWRLGSDSLLAENSEIQTISRIGLELPKDKSASILMDLKTHFVSGDASATPRYLPVGIMNPILVKWLDRAIVEGKVLSGSCVVNGPLQEFPFHKTQDGRFEVIFKTRDMTIDYWPGWPQAKNITAEVRFLNNSFELLASEGRIFNIGIRNLHAGIESMQPTSPLMISIKSDGPVNDHLRFLAQSPLRARFAPLVKNFSGSGSAGLTLNLMQPFKDSKQISLNGRLSMNGAGLNLLPLRLPVTGIQGDLIFNEAHLRAKGLTGQVLGGEGRVDIFTPTDNDKVTRLSATGNVTRDAIKKRFPEAELENFQGKASWRMQLDIPHTAVGQAAAVPLEIGSDLMGMAIDLPAPLGKKPGQSRNLLVNTDLRSDKQTPIQVHYDDILDASLLFGAGESDKRQLSGISLRLGGGKAQPAKPQRLEIRGHLQQLQLSDWLARTKNRKADGTLPPLTAVDLKADFLQLGKSSLKNSRLMLQRSPEAWVGEISSDKFAGKIRIPIELDQKSIDISLQRLNLTYTHGFEAESEPDKASEPIHINPGDIPSIHLTAKQLKINDYPFGLLELQIRRKPQSQKLEMLTLDSPRLQLSASGGWQRNEWFQQTQLDLNLKSNNFGQLLADLGIWSNMEMAPADIYTRLHWNSAPQAFQLKHLNGQVSLKLGEGQLLEIKPGMGRLLGLLNIGSLQRRLHLDFNDMTHKGLAFDKIEGDFKLEQGDAHTDNLSIKGPAASIDVSGRYGLGTRDLDKEIIVTPNISSSLSLAGFAAGPQVGAAMILAQRLVGKKIDEASRSRYSVTGPLNELKVVRILDSNSANNSDNLGLTPIN